MPDPHQIRLRGPWDYEPLERFDAGELPASGRVQLPSDCESVLGPDFAGRVRLTRRFNRPTNLGPQERVWLVFEGVGHRATVSLNSHPLGNLTGKESATRFDVTMLLESHNVLVVEAALDRDVIHAPVQPGARAVSARGLLGDVRLQIE